MKLVPGFWSCHAACWHQVIFILLGNIYDSTPFQLICMLSMIWMFCSLVENLCFVLNSFQKFQVGCCLCLAGQQLVHGEMFSSGCSSTPPGRFDNAENRLHIAPIAFSEGQGVLWESTGRTLGVGMTCRFVKYLENLGLTCAAYKAVAKLTLLLLILFSP